MRLPRSPRQAAPRPADERADERAREQVRVAEPSRVVLLGGTSEIGLAVVRRLGRGRSLDVVLAGRPGERLADAVVALAAEGHRARAVPLEARDRTTWTPALEGAFPAGERVDVVVLALGTAPDGKRSWQDPLAAADLVQVNSAAPVALAAGAAQRLRAQGGGALVVVSSAAAVRARSTDFAHGASKAALDAFASGLREAVRGDGVRVLVVRPGFVRTRLTAGRSAWLATTKEAVADLTAHALAGDDDVVWAPPGARAVVEVLRWVPPRLLRRLRL